MDTYDTLMVQRRTALYSMTKKAYKFRVFKRKILIAKIYDNK